MNVVYHRNNNIVFGLMAMTLTFSVMMLAILCLIMPASAFNITTDQITETSIIWNLSAKDNGVNITAIAFDGIALNGYIANPKQLVQNNLYEGETHLIIVDTDDGLTSTGEATTLTKPQSESEKALGTVNQWILVFLSLGVLLLAVLIGINLIAYISLIIAFIGILSSIGNSFWTGVIFVVTFAASALVAYDW